MNKLKLDGHRAHSAWYGLYTGHTTCGTHITQNM